MTYIVTGSTGLIGSALVKTLAAKGERVVATARDTAKAERLFGGLENVAIAEWDVVKPFDKSLLSLPSLKSHSSACLIHAAAETASRNMVERPVETMAVTLDGTRNALELARALKVKGMVYLSSMEVYGAPQEDSPLDESCLGPLDILAPRSSYPLSKRMAEGLCAAYAREYGVPVRIARLAQVVGGELFEGDNRVVSQFARAIVHCENIVLHTDGSSARCYCALDDAVNAVLLLLERGVAGEAYNVADEASYCSIREFAERLCALHPGLHVVVRPAGGMGYAPACRLRLSAAKLKALGWRPRTGLMEAFERLVLAWKSEIR